MSFKSFRQISHLLPEAQGIIKKADVDEDFSTRSRDATLASHLKVAYLRDVAKESVSPAVTERVKKAVSLYDLEDQASELTAKMLGNYQEKVASQANTAERLEAAKTYFETQLCGSMDIEKTASYAERLHDEYGNLIDSDEVRRYAGAGVLHKEAAVAGLVSRGKLTGNPEFFKVAKVIEASKDGSLDHDDVRLICHAVTQMDKKANLQMKGYNFYREAVRTKSAELKSSLTVDLNGKSVPIESVYNLGQSRVSQAIGSDIGKELFQSGPAEMKAMLESLPMDLKSVVLQMTKG